MLLGGTQSVYCDVFRKADQKLRRAQGSVFFIGGYPRHALEALGMVLIAALAYALSQKVEGISSALPVLGALALGAQRLLPSLQQIYYAWSSIAGYQTSLADTIALLDQPLSKKSLQSIDMPLIIQDKITLKDVRFRYISEGPWVLNGLISK